MGRIHRFTEEQIEFIKDVAWGTKKELIKLAFNKRFNTDLSYTQINNIMKRKGIKNGLDCKFKKGMTPHNKGKKMPPDVYEKVKPTMFKKGNVSNIRKIGSERVNRDGYIEIKIADPNKWRLKHLVIWEGNNGPIPKGHNVIFLDNDKENTDISNLVLVTKSEHLYLNHKKLRFEDKDLTQAAVNLAKMNSAIMNNIKK